MADLRDLAVPVVGAPMAGGPTTPELVVAVGHAGGLGQLAAGYLSPERVAVDIAAVRAGGVDTFGVNIFVPESEPVDRDAVARYRDRLLDYAASLDVQLPALDELGDDDDHFDAKIALMCDERIPVVSFAFGCPPAAAVAELRRHGCSVGVTITTADDAVGAADVGADWLCVQGPDAGGHRSVFDRRTEPPTEPLDDLLEAVRARVALPLVAAGGVATPDRADQLRSSGAAAVQVGTLLLRTLEAGTKPAHADALADPARTGTVVTRAFSGRPARALRNRFTDEFSAAAVAEYPAVNKLTGGIRRAAATDPDVINLWAGTGFREAVVESATETIRRLG
ncbi:nitronate monooxygenase [Gordonia rubripertincta]|uniref:Propionate 3-nitronate monooxygenase n=2 Tax=Gordonia rubripertincta TaxID=36822 RepID=A0AAW6RBG5_GORRU|nr:nitronate monooxygenase [Gordonia rubripertincta]MDG6783309.1 nitronate monooxygenase [Gordonia rubripertincta]NKY61499.1 nitronate monooxygenase [Gordonia rubripertincta]NKY61600.1 nitronate monooxygenase [Gordonia rubripertincta]GAB83999.1 putative 2-nitropropane dioxygenase [Gordonia rubripertincta NBRC 101908]